ncbi:radical SAM protein [Muribaculum sp.]|uniref:radical SAM protein n=1 Tax=Muribaculum sp. TaxID=1918611 RepID=UPI00258A62D0|nr:radical SAM protein [Muribaculum sp.]MCX4279483.1 radical SAM protein [Muribaculum sp.]
MLIQITNRCQEGCRHCLQNSLPDGPHMTEAMFKRTLAFGKFLRCMTYVISGGEPTEHPQFYDFCKMLNNFISKNGNKAAFTVVSNGMWYPEQVETMRKLARLEHYAGMQVYTNQQWYKDYDFIMAHKEDLEAIEKVKVDTEPLQMQDLGRARFNEDAQLEVAKNPYHMSCLNGHLIFKQVSPMRRLDGLFINGTMCKPLVDFRGNVHLSESCLCPSFGNVDTDLHMDIFRNLQEATPCLKCAGGRKYIESTAPDIVRAKNIIGV